MANSDDWSQMLRGSNALDALDVFVDPAEGDFRVRPDDAEVGVGPSSVLSQLSRRLPIGDMVRFNAPGTMDPTRLEPTGVFEDIHRVRSEAAAASAAQDMSRAFRAAFPETVPHTVTGRRSQAIEHERMYNHRVVVPPQPTHHESPLPYGRNARISRNHAVQSMAAEMHRNNLHINMDFSDVERRITERMGSTEHVVDMEMGGLGGRLIGVDHAVPGVDTAAYAQLLAGTFHNTPPARFMDDVASVWETNRTPARGANRSARVDKKVKRRQDKEIAELKAQLHAAQEEIQMLKDTITAGASTHRRVRVTR